MNNFEQIESYLSGAMNAAEKAAFETLLTKNAALKKDYDLWVETGAIISRHEKARAGVHELHNTLTPLTKEYFTSQQKNKGNVIPIKKYLYAAMAVAAALLLFFLIPAGNNFENYEVTPMPGAVVRGTEDPAKTGARLFNDGQYAEAQPYLQQQVTARPDDATGNFYYAVALIKTGNYTQALPIFEKLTQGNSAYKEDSYFFAALSAYKNNQKDVAANFASAVPPSNRYYKNAKQLLKKLPSR